MVRRLSEDEKAWLVENVPKHTSAVIMDMFKKRFGWAQSKRGLQVWACKHGLKFGEIYAAPRKLERKVRWASSPDLLSWMLEHDIGQCTGELSDAFAKEFGFRLSCLQITQFRMSNGRQTGKGVKHHWNKRPIGYVRDTGKGYRLVKVRDAPSVPGSKDNWEKEHVIAFERQGGVLKEGEVLMIADGDMDNLDMSNLVPVPKTLTGVLNQKQGEGFTWHDGESLRLAVANAKLSVALTDIANRPRRCAICGKEFTPRTRNGTGNKVRACPQCVDSGRKAPPIRSKTYPEASCHVCGAVFNPGTSRQVRCPDCISRGKNLSVARQKQLDRRL